MQITLIQAEVEQALRDYVAGRLTLAEGTTFNIDLAATRGANGITATIDLIEPGKAIPAAATTIKPLAVTKATTVVPSAAVAQAVSSTQPDPATQAPTAQENAATAQETGSVEQEAEVSADTPTAEVQVNPEEVPAEKPKSLFGGLNRPKNS